jgi:pimeloyl-ACP methyl ester carboxylesterase
LPGRSRFAVTTGCEIGYWDLSPATHAEGTVLLIHGFPETSYAWLECAERLSGRFRVLVPDYRGAGDSSRPDAGYDKLTMAADLRALAAQVGGDDPVHVVGHDLGGFVAFAYASAFAPAVATLTLVEAAVPGTKTWQALTQSPAAWHFGFHGSSVASHLLHGNEAFYVERFHADRAAGAVLDRGAIAEFSRAYSRPGAMDAALKAYGALPGDALVNAESLGGWSRGLPVLTIAGERSGSRKVLRDTIDELALGWDYAVIAGASHWIPTERPDELTAALADFFAANPRR